MIYLSWSLAQLVTVLALMWLPYLVNLKLKVRKVSLARYSVEWAAGVIFILFLAFDVGTRQHDLRRSSFDAQAPVAKEKVSRETMSREDAKQTFENAVKETK